MFSDVFSYNSKKQEMVTKSIVEAINILGATLSIKSFDFETFYMM